jgi:CDP-diacylglycerol--serine O-phosphatidyltransferase
MSERSGRAVPELSPLTAPHAGRVLRFLPNVLTLGAAVCGVTSIRLSSEGSFLWAALAIVGAALFDGADGFAARRLHAESELGAELDSLADFLDFGVAPAIFLYACDLHALGAAGWAIALAYLAAAGFRLGRYNILRRRHPPTEAIRVHRGVPSTASAIGVLAIHFAGLAAQAPSIQPFIDAASLICMAALMVSTLRVPTLAAVLAPRRRATAGANLD